jgi:hypothetical protein
MKCFGMFHFTRVYVMLILALLLDPLAFLLPRVAITLDTCYRSGIFQAFTLQSIKKNRLSLWLLPIILFQTWDYTRRISCIYCTNHFVSDLGLYKEDLIYLLHQSSPWCRLRNGNVQRHLKVSYMYNKVGYCYFVKNIDSDSKTDLTYKSVHMNSRPKYRWSITHQTLNNNITQKKIIFTCKPWLRI